MSAWHPIPTFAGRYEMSADGCRVRGLYRGSKKGARRRETPYELKPVATPGSDSIRFALSTDGKTSFYHARYLHGLVQAQLGDASVWFPMPEPYAGLYEVNVEGDVRSLCLGTKGGLKRRKNPRMLTPRYTPRMVMPRFHLSTDGKASSKSLRVIAEMFPLGHPVRFHVLGERERMMAEEGAAGDSSSTGAPDPLRGVPKSLVDEIREWWRLRFTRRRHQVTKEILCDLYRLKKAQVDAIVAGVDAVRASAPVEMGEEALV